MNKKILSKLLFAIIPNVAKLPTIGATGFIDTEGDPGLVFSRIMAAAFTVILVVGGLWTFFTLLMGGFSIISSGGDQQKLEEGRNKITYALIGIIVLAASWALILVIQSATGACFGFGCKIILDDITP